MSGLVAFVLNDLSLALNRIEEGAFGANQDDECERARHLFAVLEDVRDARDQVQRLSDIDRLNQADATGSTEASP